MVFDQLLHFAKRSIIFIHDQNVIKEGNVGFNTKDASTIEFACCLCVEKHDFFYFILEKKMIQWMKNERTI